MSRNATRTRSWLIAVVLAHFLISGVHGAAHAGARVPLSPAANFFVYAIILAGPLLGLALIRPAAQVGGWLIALTMAGALVFGLVNHFLLTSPDQVGQVAADWRPLFATTAGLLAATEALGSGLAIRFVRERSS